MNDDIEKIIETASRALFDVLYLEQRRGKKKSGEWKDLPEDVHLHKARRHTETYELQRDGYQKVDGEDHLKNALARIAMVLVLREER